MIKKHYLDKIEEARVLLCEIEDSINGFLSIQYIEGSIREVAQIQAALSELNILAKKVKIQTQKAYDNVRQEIFPDLLDVQGISKASFPHLGTVSVRFDIRASIVSGKNAEALAWLDTHDMQGLSKPTINAQSLKAAIKETALSKDTGVDFFPSELFNIHPYSYVSITKK